MNPTHPQQPDRAQDAAAFIHLLDGRWTLAIVVELFTRGLRYQDLHDALDGISYKVLTDTLRRAERDGLVGRHVDPSRIETATLYELTDLGRSLQDPLNVLVRWVEANWRSVEAAHRRWEHLQGK